MGMIYLYEYLFDHFLKEENYKEADKYAEKAVMGGILNKYDDVMHGLTTLKHAKLLIWLKEWNKADKALKIATQIIGFSHGFDGSFVFEEMMDLKREVLQGLSEQTKSEKEVYGRMFQPKIEDFLEKPQKTVSSLKGMKK